VIDSACRWPSRLVNTLNETLQLCKIRCFHYTLKRFSIRSYLSYKIKAKRNITYIKVHHPFIHLSAVERHFNLLPSL